MNQMKKHLLWLLFVTFVVLAWFLTNQSMYQNHVEITVPRYLVRTNETVPDLQTTLPQNKPQMVLIYTSFSGRLPWTGLKTSQDFTQFKGQNCRETNCKLTYDRHAFS